MSRVVVTPDALALHIEVALSGASPSLLTELQNVDRYRRGAAFATLARQLAQRLNGFEITSVDFVPVNHPSFFKEIGG
jgi:hypothetical protein